MQWVDLTEPPMMTLCKISPADPKRKGRIVARSTSNSAVYIFQIFTKIFDKLAKIHLEMFRHAQPA